MSSDKPPAQTTPAGWYPGENGLERYWNGNDWTDQSRPSGPPSGPPIAPPQGYYQQGPPPKKKHTLRNVLLAMFLLGILFIGGCMALIGGAANEVDKALKEEESNNKPATVAAGEAFTHDDYEADAGWKVVNKRFAGATINGLRLTNNAEEARAGQLTFRFYKGNENLGEIECTSNQMQAGEKSRMQCFSLNDKFPKGYDTIKVSDMW